ncbi:MAG UNVERIFIED_CONTAM: protein-tyrosine-phosphatase [Planctomycetaceae bacterium]|jgi:arsenate reductase
MEWITPQIDAFLQARENEQSLIPADRQKSLREVADWISSRISASQPAPLVFICTHNSRRSHFSQIWASIAARRYGLNSVQTFSGGTEVTAMNMRVADSLRRSGLVVNTGNPQDSNPRYLVQFAPEQPPLICFSKIHNQPPNPDRDFCAVMTCSHADEACPLVPGCSLRAPIRYQDPKVSDGTPDEAATYDERSRQICREMMFMMRMVQAIS